MFSGAVFMATSLSKHVLRSMTAYGRAAQTTALGRFVVEIQTLNRRHLEIHVALPKQLIRFDMDIRKRIEAKISRGQVNVSLAWQPAESQTVKVIPNLPLINAVKTAGAQIAEKTGIIQADMILELLSQQRELLFFEEELHEETLYVEILHSIMQTALEQVVAMREKEGEALASDLEKRISLMEELLGRIEGSAHKAPERYREKLRLRLAEFFAGQVDNEEKVLREIALFAEKIDITEEIVRFRSHLHQLRLLLQAAAPSGEEAKGKNFEFLVQELHREINTIGSKSSDLGISQWVVMIKSELERVREQVQNIE